MLLLRAHAAQRKLLLKDVTQVLARDNRGLIGLVVSRIVVGVELVFWGVVKEFF